MRACSAAKSCLTLGGPMDCSPPGSSVRGISQARILEWAAIPFFMVYSQTRDRTCISYIGQTSSLLLSYQGSPETRSVQSSPSVMSDSLRPYGLQHARLPCPSPTFGACSNSCPLSQWCHPTTSSSAIPFCSCLQSFPASRSFPRSQFFALGSQSIGISSLASVLPMNTQDWFSLGWTGLSFLQFKGLSRVFSKTTVQKHKFFGV